VLKVWSQSERAAVSKFKLWNKCVYLIGIEEILVLYFRGGRPF
jgi:hypothetical protein